MDNPLFADEQVFGVNRVAGDLTLCMTESDDLKTMVVNKGRCGCRLRIISGQDEVFLSLMSNLSVVCNMVTNGVPNTFKNGIP